MGRLATRLRDALVNRAYRYGPAFGRRWWDDHQNNQRISRSPDRAVLQERIFPRLLDLGQVRQILWIGCAPYTKGYYGALESKGAQCWTIDINPRTRNCGRRGRHTVGDMRDLAAFYPRACFDVICCSGVFGYGVDSPDAQRAAAGAMAQCTRSDGWMLLGWNTDKIGDPIENGTVTRWFEPAELPGFGQRLAVAGCTHVYDFLKRRESSGALASSGFRKS